MNFLQHMDAERTQFDQVRSDQVKNNDGAFVFEVNLLQRLERFLILGAEGGTYYVTERQLTRDNAQAVTLAFGEQPELAAKTIADVSQWGRAPRVSPALFALALGASHVRPDARKAALEVLPLVARTASHLFEFVKYVDALRGWGPGLCRAIGAWYQARPAEALAYQVLKYRQRNGWTHRDLLRKARPDDWKFTPQARAVVRYAVAGLSGCKERLVESRAGRKEQQPDVGPLPAQIVAFEALQKSSECLAPDMAVAAEFIRAHRLTHEMVPDRFKRAGKVIWNVLFEDMPLGALVRQLGKLTSEGVFDEESSVMRAVIRLTELKAIRKSRLHPLAFLMAQRVYAQGHGEKGKLSWTPCPEIVGALERAFYLAFGNVEPTGKKLLLCLDVSGSMHSGSVGGVPNFSPRQAVAAMALVTLKVESHCQLVGFSHQLVDVRINREGTIAEACEVMESIPMGGTDCALPFLAATRSKAVVDGFVIYTDSETNSCNSQHPYLALQEYRRVSGTPARLCVVGMTSTGFTIADPKDAGMLDVVGFDSRAPSVISDFLRGKRAPRIEEAAEEAE